MSSDAYLQKEQSPPFQSIFRNVSPGQNMPSEDITSEMKMPVPSSSMLPYLRKTQSDDSSVSTIASRRNDVFRANFAPSDPRSQSRSFRGRRASDPRMERNNMHRTKQFSPSPGEMTIHDLTSAKEILDSLSSSFSNLMSIFTSGGNLDGSQYDASILKDEDFVFVMSNSYDEIIDTRNEREAMNSFPTRGLNTKQIVSQVGNFPPRQMREERE